MTLIVDSDWIEDVNFLTCVSELRCLLAGLSERQSLVRGSLSVNWQRHLHVLKLDAIFLAIRVNWPITGNLQELATRSTAPTVLES